MLISSSDHSPASSHTLVESAPPTDTRRVPPNQGSREETLINPWRGIDTPSRGRTEVGGMLTNFHAAPLSPLKDRDEKALGLLFCREDMEEVERDVDRCLLLLWPEPCWEDDAFEFLKEYL